MDSRLARGLPAVTRMAIAVVVFGAALTGAIPTRIAATEIAKIENPVAAQLADLRQATSPKGVKRSAPSDLQFVTITAGDNHACGITGPGALYCWGDGSTGALGPGAVAQSTLVHLAGSDWASVAAGSAHTCAIASGGSLWCWGQNAHGQLGNGSTASSAVPVEVEPTGGSGGPADTWVLVAAGGDTTCGLLTDKSAWCWGANDLAQVDASGIDTAVPVSMVDPTGTGWRSIAVSATHACGIATSNYDAYCWGDNSNGALGDDLVGPQYRTNGSFRTISVGVDTTCATGSGSAYCWGSNEYGKLGMGYTYSDWDYSYSAQYVDLPASVAHISVSANHVCAALSDARSTVACWGSNSDNQVTGNREEYPDTEYITPYSSYGATLLVATGRSFTCKIATEALLGRTSCWGANDLSQLGEFGVPSSRSDANLFLAPISDKTVVSADFLLDISSDSTAPVTVETDGWVCYPVRQDGGGWGISLTGEYGSCLVTVTQIDTGEHRGAEVSQLFEVRQVILRNKKITFLAVDIGTGETTPIRGAKVTWTSGDLSSARSAITNAKGIATFPSISGGMVTFTLTGGRFSKYAIVTRAGYAFVGSPTIPNSCSPGGLSLRTRPKSSGGGAWDGDLICSSSVGIGYSSAFRSKIQVVPPAIQPAGKWTVIPGSSLTCGFAGLTVTGCKGPEVPLAASSKRVLTVIGWCPNYGYQSSCISGMRVEVRYQYKGVVQTAVRWWGDCLSGYECIDADGVWQFEMPEVIFLGPVSAPKTQATAN